MSVDWNDPAQANQAWADAFGTANTYNTYDGGADQSSYQVPYIQDYGSNWTDPSADQQIHPFDNPAPSQPSAYDTMFSGSQQQQPSTDPFAGATATGQASQQQQPDYNPFDAVGNWIGNTWNAFAQPYEQPTKQNMNAAEWLGDATNKALSGGLGAFGEALKPAGGLVDSVANSNIPGLNVGAGAVRNIWEQAVEPVGNFATSEYGALSRGGNVLDMLHGAGPGGWLIGGAADILQGRDPTQYYKDVAGNLPQVQLGQAAFDPNKRAAFDTLRQQGMTDAYNQIIQSGGTVDQANQAAAREGMKLVNPLNLAEYQGSQEFSQLPSWAQLPIMFSKGVINPGNLAYETAIGGPKFFQDKAGGLHLNDAEDRTPISTFNYAQSLPGKAIGAGANALADVTGTRPFFDKVGQVIEGPQKFYANLTNDLESVKRYVQTVSQAFHGDTSLAEQAVFLDPESPHYWEKNNIRPDVAEKAAEYLGVIDKNAAETAGTDQPVTPQQEALPKNEVDLARRSQDTSPAAANTLFDEGKPEPQNTFQPLPPEPDPAVVSRAADAAQAEVARVEAANPGTKVQFDEKQNPLLVRPDGTSTPIDDPALKAAFSDYRELDKQVQTRPASVAEQASSALQDFRDQRVAEMRKAQPGADLNDIITKAKAEADTFRPQLTSRDAVRDFRLHQGIEDKQPFDTGVPQADTGDFFNKRVAPPNVDITDVHRAVGIPDINHTPAELLDAVGRHLGYDRQAFRMADNSTPKNPRLRQTVPLEQFGTAGKLLNKFASVTMPYMGRAFLNKQGRAIRDTASNVLKYVAEGFGHPDTNRFERIHEMAGQEHPADTLPMGKASSLADIGGVESRGGTLKELFYHVMNPFDELSGDLMRAVSKKFGKGDAIKDWNDFTEKAEGKMKSLAYKSEFLRQWDQAIKARVEAGSLDPAIAAHLRDGTLTPKAVEDFMAQKMPKGSDLDAMAKRVYNPQHFADALREKYDKIFGDQAGEIGRVVKESLDSLSDRVDKYNADNKTAFEKATKNMDRTSAEYKTARATWQQDHLLRVGEVDPNHPLWQEMKQDAFKQLDVANAAAKIQESLDPAIRAAVRDQIVRSMDWVENQRRVVALKTVLAARIDTREKNGDFAKYDRKEPQPAQPSPAPAARPTADRSGFTQRLPNNVDKLKLQSEILKFGRDTGNGTAAEMARKQLDTPDPSKVIVRSDRADGPHFRVVDPKDIGNNGQAETQVWPPKAEAAKPADTGVPGTSRDRILKEIKATGYNEAHANAGMQLLDAYADAYSRRTGRSADDVYDAISFKPGDKVGAASLKQTADIRAGLEPRIDIPTGATMEQARMIMRDWTDAKYGPALTEEDQVARFLDFADREISYQLGRTTGSGTDWYSSDWDEAMAKVRRVFPELNSDEQAGRLFAVFTGLTSQRNPVGQNMVDALNAFEQYARDSRGRIPQVKLNGTKYGVSTPNLIKLQSLVDNRFGGDLGRTLTWLGDKHTFEQMRPVVERLFSEAKPETLENKLTQLQDDINNDRLIHEALGDQSEGYAGLSYGASVFGPKIGNFVANLLGAPDRATKDMWFMTTWNRYMGNIGQDGFPLTPTTDQIRVMDLAMVRLVQNYRTQHGVTITMPQAQALLWFYEKQLEELHDLRAPSDSFNSVTESSIQKARAAGLEPGRATPATYRRITPEDTGSGNAEGVRGNDAGSGGLRQEAGRRVLGTTDLEAAGKYVISLFKDANASTMPHELAHVFRQMLPDDLLKPAEDFTGVKDGLWDIPAEEKFARGFENYLRSGKAPTPALQAVFQQFRDWLVNIYKKITGSEIDVKLTPEIKKVFDQMLGGDAEKIVARETTRLATPKEKAAATKPAEAAHETTFKTSRFDHFNAPTDKGGSKQANWKLHLTVKPENRAAVDKHLQDLLDMDQIKDYKQGNNGGQDGKDFTVYTGSKENTGVVADNIHRNVGQYLDDPAGEALVDDVPFVGKVMGRFDARGDDDFAQYGSKGIPYTKDDMSQKIWGGLDGDTARANAHKLLTDRYGEYYTGSSKNAVRIGGSNAPDALSSKDYLNNLKPNEPPTGPAHVDQNPTQRLDKNFTATATEKTIPNTPKASPVSIDTPWVSGKGADLKFPKPEYRTGKGGRNEQVYPITSKGKPTDYEVFTMWHGNDSADHASDSKSRWFVRNSKTGETYQGSYLKNSTLLDAVKKVIREKPQGSNSFTRLAQTADEHTPEELAAYASAINAPPSIKMSTEDGKLGQVVAPHTLRNYITNWNRGKHYGELTDTQHTTEQHKQYARDILATDEYIRSATGNTFKLDLDNFTPVRVSDGKSLDELMGRTRQSNIGEPRPQWPAGDPPNTVAKVLMETENYFGQDARKGFAQLKKEKGDYAVDQAYAAIAKRLGFPDPTNPATPTQKTGAETGYARQAMAELEADARDRYTQAAKARAAGTAEEVAREQTRQSLQDKLTHDIAGTIKDADQAAYKRVEGTYFDYRNKNVLDQAMGSILPFNYWARRNFAYTARYFAANPVQFAAVLQFYKNMEQENKKAGGIASYNMGNLLLWTNPDGSKVQWNMSSMMPFNPLGNSDSLMQLLDANDAENGDTVNKTPLAFLFGADRYYKGKVTGRDKGILSSFLSPNPVIDILLKTGVPNDFAKKLGIVTDGFGSPDPSDKRAVNQTTGLVAGRLTIRDTADRIGLTKIIRDQLTKMGIKFTDLDLEAPLNELIFGVNAGKPLTAVMQELTEMAQGDPKNQEQYLLALAKLKQGNWTPEALKALDTVESQGAWQRATSMAGFVSVVNNTPRQQLASGLSAAYGKVAGDNGHYEVTSTDPKTGYQTKKFVPGGSENFFSNNPGASVAFAKNKTPDQIVEGVGNDRTSKAYADLNKAYYDDKTISLKQYNKGLDDLKAGNPTFFSVAKDKNYQQAKGELPYLPGETHKTVAEVDQQYAKQEIPSERSYAEYKDTLYRAEGSGRYQEIAQKINDLYNSGQKAAASALSKSPEYVALKAARDAVNAANPVEAARKKAEDEAKYGPTPTSTSSTSGTSTGNGGGTSAPWTAAQKSLYGRLLGQGYSKAAATSVVNKAGAGGGGSTKTSYKSTGSASGGSAATSTWDAAQKSLYGKLIGQGYSKAAAASVVNKQGSTPTSAPTKAAASPFTATVTTSKIGATTPGAAAATTATSTWDAVQRKAYALALADGYSKTYATSVANKIGSGESTGYKSKLTGAVASYGAGGKPAGTATSPARTTTTSATPLAQTPGTAAGVGSVGSFWTKDASGNISASYQDMLTNGWSGGQGGYSTYAAARKAALQQVAQDPSHVRTVVQDPATGQFAVYSKGFMSLSPEDDKLLQSETIANTNSALYTNSTGGGRRGGGSGRSSAATSVHTPASPWRVPSPYSGTLNRANYRRKF